MPDAPFSILVTRPEPAALATAELLRARYPEAEIIVSPVIRVESCDFDIDLKAVRGLIFTSARAVEAIEDRDVPDDLTLFAVGDATARAAAELGAKVINAGGDAAALVRAVKDSGMVGPLVHVRGRHTRGDVAGQLNAAGVETREVVAYDQVLVDLTTEGRSALTGTRPVLVPLFSPRTAAHFAACARATAPVGIAALSPAVADAARPLNAFQMEISDHPDMQGILSSLEQLVSALS